MTTIAQLQPNQPVDELNATITALGEVFTSASGKVGQPATLGDPTGTCGLTLWGDTDSTSPKGSVVKAQVGHWHVGDTIRLVNCWVKTYDGKLEISTGYSGRLLRP